LNYEIRRAAPRELSINCSSLTLEDYADEAPSMAISAPVM
jgi:hypothetical protein